MQQSGVVSDKVLQERGLVFDKQCKAEHMDLQSRYTAYYLSSSPYRNITIRIVQLFRRYSEKVRITIPTLLGDLAEYTVQPCTVLSPYEKEYALAEKLLLNIIKLPNICKHRKGSHTYNTAVKYLLMLRRGTFFDKHSKKLSYLSGMPLEVLKKPMSSAAIRAAFVRISTAKKQNKKLPYSVTELLYNTTHPAGWVCPFADFLDPEQFKKRINVQSVDCTGKYPATTALFAEFLQIDVDTHLHEYRMMQRNMDALVVFKDWLPEVPGSFCTYFTVDKPGRFLKAFLLYLKEEYSGVRVSVWMLSLNGLHFRTFLNEQYPEGTTGYLRGLSSYLLDYLRTFTDVKPGYKRIQFITFVYKESETSKAFDVDRIMDIPITMAEGYISRKQAIPYIHKKKLKSYMPLYQGLS